MPDEPLQPARQPSSPAAGDETAIRGSAWMVAQQTAQMVGEFGGGIGGIAGAVHVAKGMIGGSKPEGAQSEPPTKAGTDQ